MRIIVVQQIRGIVLLTCFAIGPLTAHAEILGTYKGGFTSAHQKVTTELRCNANAQCELEATEVVNGTLQPSDVLSRWQLRPLGGCISPPKSEWEECDVSEWDAVRKALKFAREHQGEQSIPEVREMLKPLLESGIDIGRCYNLQQYSVICEMQQSPWSTPAVLYFSLMMAPCYPPSGFCTYRLLPMFRTSDVATLRAKQDGFVPERSKWSAAGQVQVGAYVRDLQDRIHSAMTVPPGAPNTARVAYQIQFNQETGRVHSVNFQDGCYCPSLRSAVNAAVLKIQPLPLLPKDQQQVLGGRNGAVYLETTTGPIR